jgi:tetrahydromethanopterin S-methyltransferase subunit G
MNPIIVTIVVATATFILSIFSALQFYAARMEKYIDAKIGALDARFDAISARFDAVNTRFDAVNARLDAVDTRLDRVERQLESIFKPSLPR